MATLVTATNHTAEQPSPAEQFEKLVAFVRNRTRQVSLRVFSLSLGNLSAIQYDGSRQDSRLEALPAEIGHMMGDYLSGNDLIMLSLASKTMAWKVDRSRTRLIANIAWYQLHINGAGRPPTTDAWRELGFEETSLRAAQGHTPTASEAVHDQSVDLRSRLREGTLLEEHGYCYVCNKFRPLAKQYWYGLCEHIELGSTMPGTEMQRHVEELSKRWALYGRSEVSSICPAHKLLTEMWPR